MIISFRITVLILLLLLSCTENPVDNNDDNTFSVEIEVVDSTGNPLPNIQVSIWSKIRNQSYLNNLESFNDVNASTAILFRIVHMCYTDLTLYDLNNKVIAKLVSGFYNAGMYEFYWSTSIQNGVYKCLFITSSDSLQNNIFYKDSIYISLISPSPNESLVSITDNNGKSKIVDKLLFPNLFNLPLIPRTLEGGPEIVGYFDYSDSVVIALSNESVSKTVMFDRLVVDGPNKYKFTLDNNFLRFEKKQKPSGNQLSNNFELKSSFCGTDTVVITSFTATADNEDVILNWITSEEFNNEGFEIQRRASSIQNWNSIGFVQGHGTTNQPHSYSFTDQNLIPDSYKYRLKQIDFDGSFSYSEEVQVDIALPLEWRLFQNYPNPFN